jgi:CHAT domain-containing protein
LEYFLTKSKILIWVITKGDVDAIDIDVPGDSLRGLVEAFRETIHWRGSTDYLSCELHKVLITPVLDKIHTERLIIVAHGVLHYLPFQALMDQDGKYLFERYQISYPAIDNGLYKPIEFSTAEVERIGRLFPNSETYTDSLASELIFRERAQHYDILHLACHAELNSSYPLYSGLLLAPGGGYDGELDVHEIFTLNLNAYLVVLSSCQTGLGQLTNGDELVGLSRAFICAGTQSLISSLWAVDDESTGYLMECLYRNLQNHSMVESLQMAQFDTKTKYKDLYHWAPFVLIGGTN